MKYGLSIFSILLFLFGSRALHPAAPVLPAASNTPVYDRHDWPHWIDADHNCLNTRAEVLKSRSKVPVRMNKRGCTVTEGLWDDYYFAQTYTKASQLDIDHLVPLKHAFENGGAAWSREQKKTFANDPENLVITNRHYNRQKGAQTPLEWLPIDRVYACRYLKDWLKVKTKYLLHVAGEERKAVEGCK